MKSSRHLPLAPLLRAYADAGPPTVAALERFPEWGPRFRAVFEAPQAFLNEAFVDGAAEADFAAALAAFYGACVRPPLHAAALRRKAGVVRHALAHLLRCPDPLVRKAERCLDPGGAYHVAGLGPSFWSAVFQGLDPGRYPAWTPATAAGLRRFGLARWQPGDRPGRVYAGVLDAYARVRSLAPDLSSLHVDHFLTLASAMQGRDLWSGVARLEGAPSGVNLTTLLRQERARLPLRRRLKERGHALYQARRRLEAGLAANDAAEILAALADAGLAPARRAGLADAAAAALLIWSGRLWEADDPYEVLDDFWRADPLPGAGLWLPAAVLHLRDPRRFQPWDDAVRRGYAALDDALDGEPPAERYRLFNEGVVVLRERHRLHSLEAPAVLAALATAEPRPATQEHVFHGFCADTFRFLAELAENNRKEWMRPQRDRYRFAAREPLAELCRALAARYVGPVLVREHGWDLETEPRSGKALTSVRKNDYGRSQPYNTALWVTFYRRDRGRRGDAQFFVRLGASGVGYGLRLGREARAAGRLFRRHVQEHAESLFRALVASGAAAECRFGAEKPGSPEEAGLLREGLLLTGPGGLRAWATGKTLVAGKEQPADSPLLTSDELVGDVLLTFDRLLPAYACAADEDPRPTLARGDGPAPFTDADFCRATYLGADWLGRARELLALKRQLILQGVPGTGKTHVARCLGRLLVGGRDDAVRLVQFHPAYSYEEFVEGIKVKSVEVGGRHDVTYPVEDGVLCAFAAEAARRPSQPFVLVIDEINRGNLPRVFGELLYLLEYRDQEVGLPYSKRGFRLPANLVLIGTMNAADRSVALVDQALRRRFSFLEMPPDPGVLSAWLRAHPPTGGEAFAAAVADLFERLNARLCADLGPHCQVGHSYFMVPGLDEERLRVVWRHHVRPLLEEYFAGQSARAAAYDLDELLTGRRSGARPRRSAHAKE